MNTTGDHGDTILTLPVGDAALERRLGRDHPMSTPAPTTAFERRRRRRPG